MRVGNSYENMLIAIDGTTAVASDSTTNTPLRASSLRGVCSSSSKVEEEEEGTAAHTQECHMHVGVHVCCGQRAATSCQSEYGCQPPPLSLLFLAALTHLITNNAPGMMLPVVPQ